jgi:hypothetical protein
MALAPDGDLLVVNGNNGNAVEVTPAGTQIATTDIDQQRCGDLIGLAVTSNGRGIEFSTTGPMSSTSSTPPGAGQTGAPPPGRLQQRCLIAENNPVSLSALCTAKTPP